MKITCRVCRVQQGEFFTLDSVVPVLGQSQHKLLDIFNKCLQLNAVQEDSLPQVVCLLCLEKLKEFFEFQLKAQNSEFEFRKNLKKDAQTEIQEVKTETLQNYPSIPSRIKEDDSTKIVNKAELEYYVDEVITSDDELEEELEEHYEDNEKIHENIEMEEDVEEREVEETDILFELYNKNDSCLENYLKFNKNRPEDSVDEYKRQNEGFNNNEIESSESNDFSSKDETESNKLLLDNQTQDDLNPSIELSNIEIARIQTTDEDAVEIQTLVLEPLVEIRKWNCPDCGRKYITEEKLKRHRKLHEQSKNCQCEICGSHLKSLFEYREHMKTHGTERKFSCEFCDKSFSTRANLKAHLYIHTNLRPYKCEICSKTFQQKSILKTHMTLHTGKPFECTLCQRRFSRTAHLNIHMRQHNNIRPYQCTECPSSYMQKSHLDRHISSSHLGVRFQCTVCGKMYTKKPSLNTHMREAHSTTISLYNCEICDLDFPKQKGLYYHLKSKHPDYKKNLI